jgi:hypothetical protein
LSVNVPVMTAGVLPAVSAALLTDVPLPTQMSTGSATFDSAGRALLFVDAGFSGVVLVTSQSAAQGYLFVVQEGSDIVCYASGGAAANDSNCYWMHITS